MSRVGYNPITIEKDVQVSFNGADMIFKGTKG
jgi:ribosomal protein L6P/L9E